MTKFQPSFSLLIFTICSVTIQGLSVEAEGNGFIQHDFHQAMEQARQTNRPLLLHFSTQWCGPCQIMEQSVFSSPQLSSSLSGKVILVKIDGDRSPELTQMYQVTSYPTDLFIDPNGRVLGKSSGMMDLDGYIKLALQVEGRYQQSRQLQLARNQSGNSPAPYSTFEIRLGAPGPFPEFKAEQRQQAESHKNKLEVKEETVAEPAVVFVALDGYCPVSLQENRSWEKGDPKFSSDYQQQRYHFSSLKSQQLFADSPEKYAPRLMGCDPVLMWETDRALPGTTRFAAYYDDQLYLFTSEENREMFRIDPDRFITLKHVLSPRHVEATLVR